MVPVPGKASACHLYLFHHQHNEQTMLHSHSSRQGEVLGDTENPPVPADSILLCATGHDLPVSQMLQDHVSDESKHSQTDYY